MDVSQHGSFTALTATRLHRPQRSFAGISSGTRVLYRSASLVQTIRRDSAYAARLSSSSLSLAAMLAHCEDAGGWTGGLKAGAGCARCKADYVVVNVCMEETDGCRSNGGRSRRG